MAFMVSGVADFVGRVMSCHGLLELFAVLSAHPQDRKCRYMAFLLPPSGNRPYSTYSHPTYVRVIIIFGLTVQHNLDILTS